MQQVLQNCDAHKFETVVESVADGELHKSKVKLCGNEGQSDTEWIHTLGDAIAKLNANKDMPASVRDQIVTAITAEIGRLKIASASAPPVPTKPDSRITTDTEALSRDYSSFPPLPQAPVVAPLPPEPPAQLTETTPVVAQTVPALSPTLPLARAVPRLTMTCYSPGDIGADGPCADFQRDTLLTIRAVENVPPGTLLRFVRNGDPRGEIELATLARGKAVRMSLPREVCAGFTDGRLELQVVSGGAVARIEGPYNLRC